MISWASGPSRSILERTSRSSTCGMLLPGASVSHQPSRSRVSAPVSSSAASRSSRNSGLPSTASRTASRTSALGWPALALVLALPV